jgi:hypothetical protein
MFRNIYSRCITFIKQQLYFKTPFYTFSCNEPSFEQSCHEFPQKDFLDTNYNILEGKQKVPLN